MPVRRQLAAAAAFAALVPLGISGKAGTCPSGSACATPGAAEDGASLLQAGPKGVGGRTGVGKWQPPRKPQNKGQKDTKNILKVDGLKENFDDSHLCGKATDFVQYPRYDDVDYMAKSKADADKAEPKKAESRKTISDSPPIGGHVLLSAFEGLTSASSGIFLHFNFVGADPYCYHGPGTGFASHKARDSPPDATERGRSADYYRWQRSCAVEILEAGSCDSVYDLGDPLFNPTLRKMNPWDCVTYTAEEVESVDKAMAREQSPDDPALLEGPSGKLYGAKASVVVYTGMGPESLAGKYVIVYDFHGREMACAPIMTHGRGLPAAEIQRPPPSLVARPGHASARALTAKNFVKYPPTSVINAGGYDVWGEVYIHERMGSTPSTYGQVLSWDLEGVDGACAGGPHPGPRDDGSLHPYSCGIHIYDGESCSETGLFSLFDFDLRHKNPWPCVAYTAAIAPKVVKTIGQGVPAYTGYTSSDIIGKVMLVHDYDGRAIACAVVDL